MIKRVRCDLVHLLITKLGCNSTGAYPGVSPGSMLLARCMLLVKGGLVSHASELILTRKFLHARWTGWSLNGSLAWTRWSSSWGIISYQLVCWTGESSHTFLWRGVGSFSVVSAPLLTGIGISTGALPAAAEVFGMSSCSLFSFLATAHFFYPLLSSPSSWVSEALFSLAFLVLLSCLFLPQSQRHS